MAIADRHGLPIAVRVTSASPHESKLVEDTLRQRHVAAVPERMIGDRAYDSDPLDERLQHEQGVELIAPSLRITPVRITRLTLTRFTRSQ